MKRMNLLPAELRPRTSARRGASYFVVAALGTAIVAMLAYGFVIRGVRQDETELSALQEETRQAQAQVDALSPYAAFADMKQTRARSVRTVAETRFDYERLARELARILPEGVSVSHLEVAPGALSAEETAKGVDSPDGLAEGDPTMRLNGCAPTQDAVADTLDRLRALSSATGVELGSSTSGGDSPSAPSGGGDKPYLVGGSSGGGGCGAVSFDATVTLAPAASDPVEEAGS